MKKYVVTIILECSSALLLESEKNVLTVSESYLNKIETEFVMDFFNRDKLEVGTVTSFSVICYSYGEYSKEKSLQIEKLIEKNIEIWNQEVDRLEEEKEKLEAENERFMEEYANCSDHEIKERLKKQKR